MPFNRSKSFYLKKRKTSNVPSRSRFVRRVNKSSYVPSYVPGAGRYDVHFHKLKTIQDLQASAGGEITAFITDDPSAATDFASLQALYDVYRVFAIKLEYFPLIPNDDETSLAVANPFPPFVVCYDADNGGFPTVTTNIYDTLLQYSKSKTLPSHMPWSFYTLVEMPTSRGTNLITGGPSIKVGGMVDIANPYTFSGVAVGAAFLVPSHFYGKLIVTRYCKLANRR